MVWSTRKTGPDWEQASGRGLEVARRAIDIKAREGNLKSFAFSNGHPGEPNYVGCYELICKDAKAKSVVSGLKHRSTGAEARPFIVNSKCKPIQKSVGNVDFQYVLNKHHAQSVTIPEFVVVNNESDAGAEVMFKANPDQAFVFKCSSYFPEQKIDKTVREIVEAFEKCSKDDLRQEGGRCLGFCRLGCRCHTKCKEEEE